MALWGVPTEHWSERSKAYGLVKIKKAQPLAVELSLCNSELELWRRRESLMGKKLFFFFESSSQSDFGVFPISRRQFF